MSKGWMFLSAMVFGAACGGESEEDDTISCVGPWAVIDRMGTECLQTKNYADEGCDGGGEERSGTCAANGFPHRCEGEAASVYAKSQCECRAGC